MARTETFTQAHDRHYEGTASEALVMDGPMGFLDIVVGELVEDAEDWIFFCTFNADITISNTLYPAGSFTTMKIELINVDNVGVIFPSSSNPFNSSTNLVIDNAYLNNRIPKGSVPEQPTQLGFIVRATIESISPEPSPWLAYDKYNSGAQIIEYSDLIVPVQLGMSRVKYWGGTTFDTARSINRWSGTQWQSKPLNRWTGTQWENIS